MKKLFKVHVYHIGEKGRMVSSEPYASFNVEAESMEVVQEHLKPMRQERMGCEDGPWASAVLKPALGCTLLHEFSAQEIVPDVTW